MVLPSKEVIQSIRNLIHEVTRFGENEENFYICEQYCLSHVMHHTYPSINKIEVKNLIDGYVLRFFIHGYFKVANELDKQVKKFLSRELIFKQNPEFDIQWVLLSLLTGLATNLTVVSKLPKIMSLDEEEKPANEIDWGIFLKEGLPNYECQDSNGGSDSDDLSFCSQSSNIFSECEKASESVSSQKNVLKNEIWIKEDKSCTKISFQSRQSIIDDLVRRREMEISYTRDVLMRGNFIEEIGYIVNSRPQFMPIQMLSEFELVGCVLKEFLTGENVLRRKGILNPATCSLTPEAIKNYLALIQPYVNMIALFKDFNNEVLNFESGKLDAIRHKKNKKVDEYEDLNLHNQWVKGGKSKCLNIYNNITNVVHKKSVPNVVKLYNLALTEALNSFENKILAMAENQSAYTLLDVLNELRPSLNDLSSLFSVHLSATANWLNEPNWLCSVRIIMVLYKAILHSGSNRLGFLYMNMFLYCFQAYLDITDRWISHLTLNDPHEEYIIYRNNEHDGSTGNTWFYSLRSYKDELLRIGLNEIPVLDILANKMIQVGHSIDVLRGLDRSTVKELNDFIPFTSRESFYKLLLNYIKQEIIETAEALTSGHDQEKDLIKCAQPSWKDPLIENDSDNINWNIRCDGEENGHENNRNNNDFSESCDNKAQTENANKWFSCFNDDIMAADVALNHFCTKLWCVQDIDTSQIDKTEIIEKSIWPLTVMININVKNLLNERVIDTCDLAKDVVVNEFSLKTHLRLMRNIFLFNEPHLIQPFMSMFFNQALSWQNCYALTSRLRECVELKFSDLARYLMVVTDEKYESLPKDMLQAIDRVSIKYQVEGPLQLIFTPTIMELYNDIFRHLLKLHWAHESLCKLSFRATVTAGKTDSQNRRLELLRFWCMSSLARLRMYFMAHISISFDLDLSKYQHLKEIIKEHENFVKKIHSRCILDGKNASAKDLIFNNVIPFCNEVYLRWNRDPASSADDLGFTENSFLDSQKKFSCLMAHLEQD